MPLYKDRIGKPPISMYFLSDDSPIMERLFCMYCQRTILDVKGRVDMVISTPLPIQDFGIAYTIRCKQCRQDYRLLINPT